MSGLHCPLLGKDVLLQRGTSERSLAVERKKRERHVVNKASLDVNVFVGASSAVLLGS